MTPSVSRGPARRSVFKGLLALLAVPAGAASAFGAQVLRRIAPSHPPSAFFDGVYAKRADGRLVGLETSRQAEPDFDTPGAHRLS